MAGAPAFIQHLRVDALSVVPDPRHKLPVVVVDVDFDPAGAAWRSALRIAARPLTDALVETAC